MSDTQLATRLAALTAKALRAAWSPRADLDWWGTTPSVPDGADRGRHAYVVSQLFHVAHASVGLADQLERRLDDPIARGFVATMRDDAERHAQAYRGYLERLGELTRVHEAVGAALATVRAWTGSSWAQLGALGVVGAHEAAPGLRRAVEHRDRLLAQVERRVAADHARHGEFAQLWVDHAAAAATLDEQRAAAGYLREVRQRWELAVAGLAAAPRRSPTPAAPVRALFLRLGLATR